MINIQDIIPFMRDGCSDFLACVCAHIAHLPQKEFTTELMVAGYEWDITLKKRG